MTAKKTARKARTFWAVVDDWGEVQVFSMKPSNGVDGSWRDRNGLWGGEMCFEDFVAVTGIKPNRRKPIEIAISARIARRDYT
jgi:hypothetical protein